MAVEKFSGRVAHVMFQNVPQAFYIVKMALEEEESAFPELNRKPTVTVRGNIPGISVGIGTYFAFKGKWVQHPKFGKQIEIVQAPILDEGWTPEIAMDILHTHGVSRILLTQIMGEVGPDNFIETIESRKALESLSMLSVMEVDQIVDRWQTVIATFVAVEFLAEAGIPNGKVNQVREHFGDETKEILSQNPWRLVEVDGITFEVADSVAVRLGLDGSSKDRILGAVLSASKSSTGMGHLYQRSGDIYKTIKKYDAGFEPTDVAFALARLHKSGHLYYDSKTHPEIKAIYNPWLYEVEQSSAELLAQKKQRGGYKGKAVTEYKRSLLGLTSKEKVPRKGLVKVISDCIDTTQNVIGVSLTDDQKQGVLNALHEPVSIITGLPGTGKSTSLNIAVKVLVDAGSNVLLVAPTGIAAKRMTSVTGNPAYTVHRALGAKGWSQDSREQTYAGVVGSSSKKSFSSNTTWGCNEDNPHSADIIIIDESSMLDQIILYRILKGIRESCRIVFVGDAAQLPSVGPGNVLRDLVASGRFPTVQLTEIFRQENTSDIVRAAHDIHAGTVPEYSGSKEFKFVQVKSEDKAFDLIKGLTQKLYSTRQQFQVLSPRHKGTVGITNLNEHLRELLNPKQPGIREVRIGREVLRENDRVMVVRNDYELEVFNGDTGKIARFEQRDREVEIKVHGPPITHIRMPYAKVPSLLRMAYAITVHKSQGMEYDTIVIPLVDSFRSQLQRNLIYTAITRAKKRVIILGTRSALRKAVENNREDLRNTLFQLRLEQQIT